MRILIAVDGSKIAVRATRYAMRLASAMKHPPQITLLSVDAPLLVAATVQMGVKAVEKYHAENGAFATRDARAALVRGKVDSETKLLVGDPAAEIAKVAKVGKYDLVVMGSRGLGTFKSLLLGSVTTRVLASSQVPLVIVR